MLRAARTPGSELQHRRAQKVGLCHDIGLIQPSRLLGDGPVSTPEEIPRHHDDGEIVYVGAHPTGYVVRIEEPDPTWPRRYAELEEQISTALGERLLAIQHVGSTSVPGLPAKPIIDIDVAVADPVDEAAYVPDLESLGFVHWLCEHPEDRELYAEAKRAALVRVDAPGADHGALGFGMRYNTVKEPVVREIYDRMFRADGLL